jgi:glycosyltransferase involved in cell wall biosynthesis
MNPKVSFVIPCYKLAHLLPDCVNSILSQTYEDFEVLIMDDCSPDQTPEVARSFRDARVKHIRNEPNLGHLKNYNKGIELARGQYVWLISADDFLRKPYILERYMEVMENHREVGYVFCPAMKFQGSQETEVVSWSEHGAQNAIFKGHDFFRKLLLGNCVVAPTGMVRKECYDKVSVFPLDMPNAGDWYLWCIFALHFDAAYIAKPMVCYRVHDSNMSVTLTKNDPPVIVADNIAVRWRIKKKAEELGSDSIVSLCKDAIATYYANMVAAQMYENNVFGLTLEECEWSVPQYARDENEAREMCARVYAALGDQCYLRRDFAQAQHYYGWVLQRQPWAVGTWGKSALLRMGNFGVRVRNFAQALR